MLPSPHAALTLLLPLLMLGSCTLRPVAHVRWPFGDSPRPRAGADAPATENATGALLDVIAFAEGTNDAYNICFTFKRFESYADHPRKVYCSGSLCSDAAGRYQFLSTTWDMVQKRKSLADFSPPNQDTGAVALIEGRGVRNHAVALGYEEFSKAMYKLAYEWASLPGSPYGQPTKSMATVWEKYQKRLTAGE